MLLVILLDLVIFHQNSRPEPQIDKAKHSQLPLELKAKIRFHQTVARQSLFKGSRTFVPLLLQLRDLLVRFIPTSTRVASHLDFLPDKCLIDQSFHSVATRLVTQIQRLIVQKLRDTHNPINVTVFDDRVSYPNGNPIDDDAKNGGRQKEGQK